jgi:hypothetical protein
MIYLAMASARRHDVWNVKQWGTELKAKAALNSIQRSGFGNGSGHEVLNFLSPNFCKHSQKIPVRHQSQKLSDFGICDLIRMITRSPRRWSELKMPEKRSELERIWPGKVLNFPSSNV